jgi:hypothetical protein
LQAWHTVELVHLLLQTPPAPAQSLLHLPEQSQDEVDPLHPV